MTIDSPWLFAAWVLFQVVSTVWFIIWYRKTHPEHAQKMLRKWKNYFF